MTLHQHRRFACALRRQRRVIAQQTVVEIEIRGVEAETVDAAIEPEARDLDDRFLHRQTVEIEIRHLRQEVVQMVLPAPRFPAPGRATHPALPVVRHAAVGFGVDPDVPVSLGVVATAAAFGKPCMLGGGMAPDLIDQHLQPERMRARQQNIEIRQRAEAWIDAAVIADVIAEIAHRTGEERTDPEPVDTEVGDVVQALGESTQVADAIAVAVGKAARVDLIQHRASPPWR